MNNTTYFFEYLINFYSESETAIIEEIYDDTVTVMKNGSEYIILIDCTSENEKKSLEVSSSEDAVFLWLK